MEFLLGATPKFEEYSFDEEPPEPLPDALAASLAIDLRPRLGAAPQFAGAGSQPHGAT
ncbi:MAG: hypothetical protein KF894_18065 [Labilithrix sp.]|nr:hypothetical protein [Labilithrix sp.]